MFEVHSPFAQAARDAVAIATALAPSEFKVDMPPKPSLGDYAVGCFAAAKVLGENPAAVAARVVAGFEPNQWLASATAAGPFVNFKVNRQGGLAWAIERALTGRLVPQLGGDEAICIDYSSPNISKHLAYHHIRSTVIGNSLAQIYRALGYRVVGINHLGDWGTTHGMLIAAWKKWGTPGTEATVDVTQLNELYVRFRAESKDDEALAQAGRDWFKRLEDGDVEARRLWQQFRDVSWAEFESAYQQLGIVFDDVRGESAYENALPGVLEELRGKNLVSESQGAQVVELEGEKNPLLLITRDGTTLYALRDIAAAEYRWNTYKFVRSLYVVDRGQGLHFRQVFKVLALAGHEWSSRCEHVPFGLVKLGGKKTSTRTAGAGAAVLLREVFDEATDECATTIRAGTTGMDEAAILETARMVGIGAVVFANLSTQREKDVDFVWERVLSTDGDSGPYLQYSHARCASILRRATDEPMAPAEAAALLVTDAEWAVARRLLDYGDMVARAGISSEPHLICHYLLELAGDFSRWYTAGNGDAALRVLCDDVELRRARLSLVAAAKAALASGLALLGLGAPAQM